MWEGMKWFIFKTDGMCFNFSSCHLPCKDNLSVFLEHIVSVAAARLAGSRLAVAALSRHNG